MKQFFAFALAIYMLATTVQAATPEQTCRARKNRAAASFLACRNNVVSGLPQSFFRGSTGKCAKKLKRTWRRATRKAVKQEASCPDAPLQVSDFKSAFRTHIRSILSSLGNNEKGNAAKRKCRARKTVTTGRYAACRLRAESRLARTADTATYDSRIARCESKLEASWQKIINRTAERGTTCFDESHTLEEYKQAIDEHTDKVAAALAGTDELTPLSLSISGSPVTLIAAGSSQNLTITNTSSKATAIDIAATFSGTALAGNVTESGNTCASVAPGASCTLTFTPGSTLVPLTAFTIQGSNTAEVSASLEIVGPDTATISIAGSPLSLTVNGGTGFLTVTNTSTTLTALSLQSDFTGTALDGNVTETGNTCASVAPSASCTLTFTPGTTIVPNTAFQIKGSNTATATPSMSIVSGSTLTAINSTSGTASGGTGITLTGTGLTGATSITFDGIEATSVNVVNSTTVTAVTPAHAAGIVDVVIDTPAGGATLLNGYTYVSTAVGQSAAGGTIACLNGGTSDLIAAVADNSLSIAWGGLGISIGASAQSNTDGASNTTATVGTLGAGTYAAQLCNDFEVDSQGNTACQAGNVCYSDWFLPARDQLDCLYDNRFAVGGFSTNYFWSSTEINANDASLAEFEMGDQIIAAKNIELRARCVRAFTP